MTPIDYWKECLCNAAEEYDLELTVTQLDALAEAAENGHDNYSQAFGAPDRTGDIESEHISQLRSLEERGRRAYEAAERATKIMMGLRGDEQIHIENGQWRITR
jgi:hypothetical protein